MHQWLNGELYLRWLLEVHYLVFSGPGFYVAQMTHKNSSYYGRKAFPSWWSWRKNSRIIFVKHAAKFDVRVDLHVNGVTRLHCWKVCCREFGISVYCHSGFEENWWDFIFFQSTKRTYLNREEVSVLSDFHSLTGKLIFLSAVCRMWVAHPRYAHDHWKHSNNNMHALQSTSRRCICLQTADYSSIALNTQAFI